jgi:hypothetical protein
MDVFSDISYYGHLLCNHRLATTISILLLDALENKQRTINLSDILDWEES